MRPVKAIIAQQKGVRRCNFISGMLIVMAWSKAGIRFLLFTLLQNCMFLNALHSVSPAILQLIILLRGDVSHLLFTDVLY